MATKWTLYLLAALLISSVLSFGYTYRALFASQKLFDFSHSNITKSKLSEGHGIAIDLDPERHISRAPINIHFEWDVTLDYRSPDGVRKLVYLINGAFPGPTIEARSGDTLIVQVCNHVDNQELALHWHGLHMRGANDMDGAVGITQKPIKKGANFTYEFQIRDDQTGTFWYHAHFGNQRADGLYGGLIVHKPLTAAESESEHPQYDTDSLLLVGDWYHRSAEEVQASYVTHDSWGREPVPDSLLVNGIGAFNCSMAVPSRPLDCVQLSNPPLILSEKRSRVRIVNVGAISGLVLRTTQCFMTVFQVDGGNKIEKSPKSSSVGILYPGERIDLIVECPTTPAAYNSDLVITLDAENFAIQNKALTPTHIFPLLTTSHVLTKRGHPYVPPTILKGEGYFDLVEVKGLALPEGYLPRLANQNVLLYTKMEILARLGNVPIGFINRTTWAAQSSPSEPLIHLKRNKWDKNQLVPWIPVSRESQQIKWVDIVINNLDEKGHPFHLHGYDFYVLSQYYPHTRGYHAFNPFDTSVPPGGLYNLENPPRKDTIYVPSQGYVVLRISADNIGVWFFHCHILWHGVTGMAMAVQVGYEGEND